MSGAGLTAPLSGFDLNDDEIDLSIDPLRYRSSSQGPVMEEEEVSPKIDELDEVIDRATRVGATMPVIPQFTGSATLAWRVWRGTIVEQVWPSAVLSMLVPAMLVAAARSLNVPDVASPMIMHLSAVSTGWNYMLTLTTFVTTFFVGHSHSFWVKAYALTRVVQGKQNDIALLCATHAARGDDGKLTPAASTLLKDIARELRLCHLLFWSDILYRRVPSRHAGAPFRILLSRAGLQRLHGRGLVTKAEVQALLTADLPPARWYLVVMEWCVTRLAWAMRVGMLTGGPGFEQTILDKCCSLRGACMSIPDELAARMPLSYVHFTHFLVDSLLLLAPFALYPKMGVFSIFVTGVITLFYRGLLELSKSLLDPFGNKRVSDKYFAADINIDVLIAESNAGSLLFAQGASALPFDALAGLRPGEGGIPAQPPPQ